MHRFPTDPWFQDFIERINASADYREAAATWEGDVAFLIEAEPDKGVPEDVWAWLDLWHGECRGGGIVDAGKARTARFVIRAPYSRWREVLTPSLHALHVIRDVTEVEVDIPSMLGLEAIVRLLPAWIANRKEHSFFAWWAARRRT